MLLQASSLARMRLIVSRPFMTKMCTSSSYACGQFD